MHDAYSFAYLLVVGGYVPSNGNTVDFCEFKQDIFVKSYVFARLCLPVDLWSFIYRGKSLKNSVSEQILKSFVNPIKGICLKKI